MRAFGLAVLFLPTAVGLLGVTACSADDAGAGPPAGTALPSGPARSGSAGPVGPPAVSPAEPPVDQPPELDGSETLAVRQGVTRGGRTVRFGAGKKGDALTVAVRCQGEGTVEVTVRPAAASFPLACRAGEVTTVQNQMDVSGVEGEGTVTVEAPTTVRWSMTVGRGPAAPEGRAEGEGEQEQEQEPEQGPTREPEPGV
ncbi:hypothetical protein ACF06V_17725 [Streptomyces bobili]|uniref:hypothetical protein n=1 Tax=Streptomyces bobili TaxID=67280 RepID=UPI003701672D